MKNAHYFINKAGRSIYGAYFGQGTGPVLFGNVSCNNMEAQNCLIVIAICPPIVATIKMLVYGVS